MAKNLLDEISAKTALQHYALPGLFRQKYGFLAGIFNGYLTSVGFIDDARNVGFVFIGHTLSDGPDLKKSLENNSALKALKGRFEIKPVDDAVIIKWPRLTAPSCDQVISAMAAIALVLPLHMQPWKGLCLKCDKQPSNQLCLLGIAPSILCSECMTRLPEQKILKEQEFAEKEPRRQRGLLFAGSAAVLFIAVYGLVIGWVGREGKYSVKLDAIVGLAAAVISMKSYEAGAEKLDQFGRNSAAALGIVARYCCGIAFFTSYFTHQLRIPLTFSLIGRIGNQLPKLAAGQFGGAVLFYISLALPLFVLFEKGSKGNFQHLESQIIGKVTVPSGASA